MYGQDDPQAHRSPIVSVAITAYNSAAWIARAIESALRQKTQFPVEVVVGDDGSSDDTASVVLGYQKRDPDRVRLLQRGANLGMQRNFYETFEQCRGRYIAWLDADDYWTDSRKLELQVQLLEADPSIGICGHFIRFVESSGEVLDPRYPHRPAGRYTLSDIIRENFVPSPSIVFRAGLHRELPPSYFALPGVADWPISLIGARGGDIVLIDRIMANYHQTPGSAYNAKGFTYQHSIDLRVREWMHEVLPPQWHRQVRGGIGKQYEALAYEFNRHGDFAGSRDSALKAFRVPVWNDNRLSKVRTLAGALLGEVTFSLRLATGTIRRRTRS